MTEGSEQTAAGRAGGPGAPPALYRSLVEDAFEFVVAIRPDFTVAYANQALARLTGHAPDDLVDRSIVDYLHPDDLERALLAVDGANQWGAPNGSTSFRILQADGTWQQVDVSAATVTDGSELLLAVYCRPGDYQHALHSVLDRLLSGADRAEALAPLVDVFDWQVNDAAVGIAWYEPGTGHRFVSTGLPGELCGAEERPGAPWSEARALGTGVQELTHDRLDPARRRLAVGHGRGPVWVEPVPDPGTGIPALITVWTRAAGPPPRGHAFGMGLARTHVELILRWDQQVTQLATAARTDPLTGLANRRSLFDLLDGDRRGGALLFCDLDDFKPVNDRLGHAVGDEVLQEVARRLTACVREDDVVARTGGDEFVVIARGAGTDQAARLAQRVATVTAAPIAVAGTEVAIGISIGIAHTDGPLSDATLAEADRALLRAKADRHHLSRRN